MIEMETSDYQEKAALYNLKTKEIKYIDSQYDTAWLDNGVIIVGKHGDDEYGYKYGALDLDFNDIIPIEYDGLSLISPELFMVKKRKKERMVLMTKKMIGLDLLILITKLLRISSTKRYCRLQV